MAKSCSISMIVSLILSLQGSAAEPPRAADEREYELATAAAGDPDPEQRLQALAAWRNEYPQTALEETRRRAALAANQQVGLVGETLEAAEALLALAPQDFGALYAIVSLGPASDARDARLDRIEAAATSLENGAFVKPAGVGDDAWAGARREAAASAQFALAWAAVERKAWSAAENRLLNLLRERPEMARASYLLAQAAMGPKDPSKNELAFFSLARAAAYDGPGAMPSENRVSVRSYLERLYRSYCGTDDELDGLLALASDQPLPPPHLAIRSKHQREADEEAGRRRDAPLLYVFLDLRDALTGPDTTRVWSDLRGKITPDMQLFVVGAEPQDRPAVVRLAPQPGGVAEVELRLAHRLRTGIPAGRPVVFSGVAAELERAPFLLRLESSEIAQR